MALGMAHWRNDPKEALGVRSTWECKKPHIQSHYEGALGEVAAGKYLGLPPNMGISLRGDGKKGDLIFPNGETIQVKARHTLGWDFALNTTDPHEFKDDFGILAYPSNRSILLAGYITRAEFLRVAYVTNYTYGYRLVAPMEAFSPIEELLQYSMDLMPAWQHVTHFIFCLTEGFLCNLGGAASGVFLPSSPLGLSRLS